MSIGIDSRDKEEIGVLVDKLERACMLVYLYDPRRWRRLCEQVDGLWVFGTVGGLGEWIPGARLVRINAAYVFSASTSPEDIASVIVHEGTHARLSKCGIEYSEHLRPRIEAVCVRAEIAFAHRIPQGEVLVERAERLLTCDPETWSDSRAAERRVKDLRTLGVPHWALSVLAFFFPGFRVRR